MAFSVLCFGDSLTAGYGVAPKDSWVSLLTRRFPSTRFYNHGICGCLFSSILEDALSAAMPPAKDTMLFLMGGTNDILCGIRLDSLLQRAEKDIRTLSRHLPVILGIPPLTTPDSIAAGWQQDWQYERTNEELRLYGDLLRRLAADLSLPAADFQTAIPQRNAFYSDGVHPNAEGHRLMARTAEAVFSPLLIGQ